VPQLAIHLDREIHEQGLKLDKQLHMVPIWSAGEPEPGAFVEWLADEAGFSADRVRGWDLMTHDLTPSAPLGADGEFFAAPRIDNLASCHAAVTALLAAHDPDATGVVCLFDHEEIGSVSATGAAGVLLPRALERIHALGDADASLHVALGRSACISADGAHATHPNYADRHEPDHLIALNGGPVIKRNANVRYATDATGEAIAARALEHAEVPHQVFVNRTDLACGSTIGPVTAARLGITTVDMGMPQLSMHSARELCGRDDPSHMVAALSAFLTM
jgi:aspartyl aminopeptidase